MNAHPSTSMLGQKYYVLRFRTNPSDEWSYSAGTGVYSNIPKLYSLKGANYAAAVKRTKYRLWGSSGQVEVLPVYLSPL